MDIFTPRRPGATASPVRWLSGRALRLHATLLIVGGGCLYAGWFELHRALSGNELSWVYTFEWPLFAAFAAVIWWRSLHESDEDDESGATVPGPGHAAAVTVQTAATRTDPVPAAGVDDQLRAWQDYVARLNAEHPPGGPPPRRARRA